MAMRAMWDSAKEFAIFSHILCALGLRIMQKNKTFGRRDILKAAGAGALAAALSSCQVEIRSGAAYRRPYSRKPWVAPRISMDNVIREVVGHRPYRPSGFVVKSEQFDDKTVVHNYGHGGGGISLSWGSSALAVRETSGMTPGEVGVIGGGVMGLTSARLLQDAGWNVTIYTRDMARHTTSNPTACMIRRCPARRSKHKFSSPRA